ncbi:MAG: AI-2E family transporter [Lachnospiraceae bacterium]
MARDNFEEWKNILSVFLTALVVYLVFRYVLPLVLPFVLAFLVAVLIRPLVRWLRKHLHIKESIGAVLVLISVGGVFLLLIYYGGGVLIREMQGLLAELQEQNLFECFTKGRSERLLLWGRDCTAALENVTEKLSGYFTWDRCISYCMSHSAGVVRWCTGFFTAVFVFFIASVLAVEEMEKLHQRLTMSGFYREFVDFGVFLSKVCGKWLRVQALIMLITMCISGIGLWITGFSYALLLGILIGLVDVLPIFGTGTVYLPWLIWEFLNGNPGRGFSLLIIYLICYLVREFMENVLMGKCMGITAFEFLAAVYVGLKLFGAAGFILGPLGVLIILWKAGSRAKSEQ